MKFYFSKSRGLCENGLIELSRMHLIYFSQVMKLSAFRHNVVHEFFPGKMDVSLLKL